MNRILDIGYQLNIPGEKTFTIRKVIGKGASSVTYLAECDGTEHILKECNPLKLPMSRDENGTLDPSSDLAREKFGEYLARFKEGAEKQKSMRRLMDELKNVTSYVGATYEANGTAYIDMAYFFGNTYDNIEDGSLYDMLRRIKALVNVVGHYHEMGYLHLDIKPQNIYTIPETPEMVMMFDFDSVVREDDLEQLAFLSYTADWAAPEQKMSKYHSKICRATDIYAIGEIVFFNLMGRHSEEDDRFGFSEYEYDKDAVIFKDVNPRVFALLDELFHKTLCSSPSARYQSADELKVLLDKAIVLANPHEPYLISTLPVPKSFFIGRDAEIEDIHARLQQSPVLFLHGIGGIGKSELAKQYTVKYRDEYDTVIWAPYVSDIVSMIADDNYVKINHFERMPDEKIEEYYARKKNKLEALIDGNGDRTLVIVDNFDIAEDSNTKALLKLGCRMLITTRVDFKGYGYGQKDITEFSDPTIVRKIFDYHYTGSLTEEENQDIETIIKLVNGHTMAVELIAKQIEAEWSTPAEIRRKLEEGGISAVGDENVDLEKDGDFSSDSAFGHIKALFDLSIFEKEGKENELYVLANLSLIPYTGIDRKLFSEWCELDQHGGKSCVNGLIKSGWVNWNNQTKFFSLHPLISDLSKDIMSKYIYFSDTLYKNIPIYWSKLDIQKHANNDISFQYDIFIHLANQAIHREIQSTYVVLYLSSGFWLNSLLGYIQNGYERIALYYRTALNGLKNYYSENCIEAVEIYKNLSLVLAYSGELNEAETLAEKALEILNNTNNTSPVLYGDLYNNLGYILANKSNFDKAKELYLQAIGCYDKVANDIGNKIAITYNDMGILFQDFDFFEEAEEYFQKGLNIQLETHGMYHSDTALMYSNFASFYTSIDKLDIAKEMYEHSLKICRMIYGDDHGETSYSYHGIGLICLKLKDYMKAEEYFQKGLDIRIKVYGLNSSQTATSYNCLGGLYDELQNFEEAEKCYITALTIRKNKYGEEDPRVALSYHNLGAYYRERRQFTKAKEYLQKSLCISQKTLGANNSHSAKTYYILGLLYKDMGQVEIAKKHIFQGYTICKNTLGEDNSVTINMKETLLGL